jgi:hypothetical protein
VQNRNFLFGARIPLLPRQWPLLAADQQRRRMLLAWVDATGATYVGMPAKGHQRLIANAVFTTEGLAPQMAGRAKHFPQSRTVPQDDKSKFSGRESINCWCS